MVIDRLIVRPMLISGVRMGMITTDTADWAIPCAVGRGGIGNKRTEGDGITPVGIWPMRQLWWRSDRHPQPETGLSIRNIQPDDGWCDDPAHPEYNRRIKRPFSASHEEMWRHDHAYDLVVELGYNDQPVMPGAGSAIFWHLAQPDWRPTAGCVAVDQASMLWLLTQCHAGTVMDIRGTND